MPGLFTLFFFSHDHAQITLGHAFFPLKNNTRHKTAPHDGTENVHLRGLQESAKRR